MKIPPQWTFKDRHVAQGFDQHVREQLPWYDMATMAVAHVARHYIPVGGTVYDIGASTGNIGRAIQPILDARGAELFAIESSFEMAAKYRGPGHLIIGDVSRQGFRKFDLAVCFLVLMFLQPRHQLQVMERLLMQARPGSAIVIVDKFEGLGGYMQTVMHRLTMAAKLSTGTSPEAVMEKEFSLIGVQRPLSFNFVKKYLQNSTQFFRYGEFAGYVITKQE